MPDVIGFLENLAKPEPWTVDALCAQVDPEFFFPDKGGDTANARAVCGMCDVSYECLLYALRSEERFGFWGGKSERERRRLVNTGVARRLLAEADGIAS